MRKLVLVALLASGCVAGPGAVRKVDFVGNTSIEQDQLFVCARLRPYELTCVEYRAFLEQMEKQQKDAGAQTIKAQ